MLDGILQRADERLVFGEVIRLMSQVLAQCGDFVPLGIMDDNSVTRWPRIAASAAVGMSDEVVLRCSFHCIHLPAASLVPSRCGRLAAKIRSCADLTS